MDSDTESEEEHLAGQAANSQVGANLDKSPVSTQNKQEEWIY